MDEKVAGAIAARRKTRRDNGGRVSLLDYGRSFDTVSIAYVVATENGSDMRPPAMKDRSLAGGLQFGGVGPFSCRWQHGFPPPPDDLDPQ